MEKRHKTYLKLNLMTVILIAISFISVTLAWFAYSGIANVSMDIPVKAWYIELEQDGKPVSNEVIISSTELYPGMGIEGETVKIKNLGDSDAAVKYAIVSARIFGNDEIITTSEQVEDSLSQEYPFHVNINLTKNYVLAKGEDSIFEVSISWPLDSGTDELDSYWGKEAYKFQEDEKAKKEHNADYQIRPAVQIVISLIAEQYLEIDTASDVRYNLGDIVLFDVVNNKPCQSINSECIQTYVMDVNNTLADATVKLLPSPYLTHSNGNYNDYINSLPTITNNWNVNTRLLEASDIVKIISTDVTSSVLVREGISDSVIGNVSYGSRMNSTINKAMIENGYYRFLNQEFNYLSVTDCYWTKTEYSGSSAFAIKRMNESTSKVYDENKNETCKMIPVILASKTDLNN